MAKVPEQMAWGIEIGNAGLKAMCLRYLEVSGQVIAVAYDYVPHSQFLSQPGVNSEELIGKSLDTFLSRNRLDNTCIVAGIAGQNSLVKFFSLPPVEKSKVRDIVKYEARTRIPFPLEEMVWDFQTIGPASEEGEFLLDSEVCLMAMKRDLIRTHLQPFLDRKMEVDSIQLGSLALQNYLAYDQLALRSNQSPRKIDQYTVAIDLGCEFTTMAITNGKTFWMRAFPIGGNHFTLALVKETKLTFERADHLKCNLKRSADPGAAIQVLRPLLLDLVAEIHRSIGTFSSTNQVTRIGKVICTGNAARLFGLRRFLEHNLQYDVSLVDRFDSVEGDDVLQSPIFQENILSFPATYGLALQGLKQAFFQTSLLPPEIATARQISRKKPWKT